MSLLVLDASVAAKWFLPAAGETHAEKALELLRDYAAGQIRFVVPDLFWPEFGNVLWKAVRQRGWPRASADLAIGAMKDRNLTTVSSVELLEDAFAIATAYNRTVYDALYVALAVTVGTDLVTADERLANALAAYLPVKWLGSL